MLPWQSTHAGPIYKWVDRAGNVTYSSTPPPKGVQAKELEAPTPPSEEAFRQAEERTKRDGEAARELEKQRLEREAARESEEARLRERQTAQPEVTEPPVYQNDPVYYPPIKKPPIEKPAIKPRPTPLPSNLPTP
jgi:hypothetical protein